MPRIVRTAAALADLGDIAEYIARDSCDAAIRFLQSARTTMERLAASPLIGGRVRLRHPQLQDVRKWPVEGFENYLVFYRPSSAGIEVIRVLHGARDIPQTLRTGKR